MASEGYKICPVCGKKFFVPDFDIWVFKRSANENFRHSEVLYFNKYECKNKYDKKYEEELHRRKVEAAKKGHENRKRKIAEKQAEHKDGKKNVGRTG